jgi:Ca-activated chloride channel family protein
MMRCKYCGTLQDEPQRAKTCVQCGGELAFSIDDPWGGHKDGSYVKAQLELDQVAAPEGQVVERHLIMTIETPDAIPSGEQAETDSGRETLHFVVVLDTSGSMQGDKIDTAKQAVRQAALRLVKGDLFSLVTFADLAQCPLQSVRVDAPKSGWLRSRIPKIQPARVDAPFQGKRFGRAIEGSLQRIQVGGQTALCDGLELGIQQVVNNPQNINLVLLLSDGRANVGETDVEAIGRRALDARSEAVTVSALGVGYDYNEAVMAEIAMNGGGRFYHITDASRIAAYLTGELGAMASLAARGATATLHLPAGTGVQTLSMAYPVQGASPVPERTSSLSAYAVLLGDMPVTTTLEVVARVLLPPQPAGSRLPIDGTLNYQSPAGNAFATPLNTVTVRYDKPSFLESGSGLVRPIAMRVLSHMHDTSVLATSKAAMYDIGAAQRQSETEIAKMRAYSAPLGEDREIAHTLHKSEGLLREIASGMADSPMAKDATYTAMLRHRGSKPLDFAISPGIGLCLVVAGTGAALPLPQQGEVLIGRADPRIMLQPDVDLGPHSGEKDGVSRRHARLRCGPGEYLLEDLQSTNGTYVNDVPVTPGQPVPVHTGDVIKLGQMTLIFYEA